MYMFVCVCVCVCIYIDLYISIYICTVFFSLHQIILVFKIVWPYILKLVAILLMKIICYNNKYYNIIIACNQTYYYC